MTFFSFFSAAIARSMTLAVPQSNFWANCDIDLLLSTWSLTANGEFRFVVHLAAAPYLLLSVFLGFARDSLWGPGSYA